MTGLGTTIDLGTAAQLLGAHPETVRLKVKAGALPGRKVGKRWMFSKIALERYLAGEWIPRVVQGDLAKEGEPCRSLNAKAVPSGITSCTPLVAARRYKEALAPTMPAKRRSSTTG
ncbi:Helix-turn-helix domain protein [compost metagenome]